MRRLHIHSSRLLKIVSATLLISIPISQIALFEIWYDSSGDVLAWFGSSKGDMYSPLLSSDYGIGYESETGCTVPTQSADNEACVKQWNAKGGAYQSEPPRIFDPDELSRPIQVGASASYRDVQCDIPCQYSSHIGGLVSDRVIVGTPWRFKHSMEGSHYYSSLTIDHEAYKSDRYFSTTSFQSEIPLPYYSMEPGIIDIQQPAVNWSDTPYIIRAASFLARNCGRDREKWVQGIMNAGSGNDTAMGFRVDAVSRCLHNVDPPPGVTLKDKWEVMKRYLFHLSFENGILEDYITEKLWGALASGTLPVYYGAPNIHEHVPPKSIIVATDFDSPEELGRYLSKVAANKTLYDSYHAWRYRPLPADFVRRYNMTNIHSECRTCRWAYAKKFGLKWDHVAQDIVMAQGASRSSFDSIMDRAVCVMPIEDGAESNSFSLRQQQGRSRFTREHGKDALLVYPFVESWHAPGERSYALRKIASGGGSTSTKQQQQQRQQQKCFVTGRHVGNHSSTSLGATFSFRNGLVYRSVAVHDNVIDMFVRVDYNGREAGGATSGAEDMPMLILRIAVDKMIGGGKYYFTSPGIGKPFTATLLAKEGNRTAGENDSKQISIQNNVSRLTVLTDWFTHLSSPQEGAIDIAIQRFPSSLPLSVFRRIRFVLEDPIHFPIHFNEQDGTPTHFCNVAAQEFFDNITGIT